MAADGIDELLSVVIVELSFGQVEAYKGRVATEHFADEVDAIASDICTAEVELSKNLTIFNALAEEHDSLS